MLQKHYQNPFIFLLLFPRTSTVVHFSFCLQIGHNPAFSSLSIPFRVTNQPSPTSRFLLSRVMPLCIHFVSNPFLKQWYNVNYLSVFTQFSYCPSQLLIIFLSSYLRIFNVNFTWFIRYYLCIPTDQTRYTRGLRRGYMTTQLLELRFRIPPWAWMCISCECCVLSGRNLRDGPITRPEENYGVCDVAEWDRRPS